MENPYGSKSMQKSKASETAIACAVVRAAHQILDDMPKILDDPLSVGLVEGGQALFLVEIERGVQSAEKAY
jgi:O-methyltransferase involved in polyketide biosynthesis